MLRKAVSRVALTLAATMMFVTGSVTDTFAQGSTGVIRGRVVTPEGQPIVAARVTVVGTGLGNVTDAQGNYFINNVSAGLVTVRAASLGYQAKEIKDQRIIAGNTVTLDFTLSASAVEVEAIVVNGERNPLVPRDQVSSRAIVTGETIDKLPMDNSANIIRLQPGVISTNRGDGYSIRGSREGEAAVYIDGVPIRRLQTGSTQNEIEVPTNGLAQVDVTTGGISARFGNAQSGVINFVTKSGGTTYSGSASLQSTDLAPLWWRTGLTRGELSFGGPVPFVNRLSFFAALTLEGQRYGTSSTRQETHAPNYIITGLDTVIRLPRTNAAKLSGCTNSVGATCDSVDIFVPKFTDIANGDSEFKGLGIRNLGSTSDETVISSKLTYGLGRGSKLDLSWQGRRGQSVSYGLTNPESQSGSLNVNHILTASGYFILNQSADHALALDTKVSYQVGRGNSGPLDIAWLNDNRQGLMGFHLTGLKFIVNDLQDRYPVSEKQLLASRSKIIPPGLDYYFKDKPEYLNYGETAARSGAAGLAASLRYSPYGGTAGSTQGIGDPGLAWDQNSRWYTTAQLDYQMTRYNRIWIGGEMTTEKDDAFSIGTFSGSSGMSRFTPKFGGIFLQDRLDIGDVVLETGLRYDRFDANYFFPRIPGFAATLPDSLTKDKWIDPGYQGVCGGVSDAIIASCVAAGTDTSFLGRIKENTDCGGDLTAAKRTNADGVAVCKNNFIDSKVHTVLSPKIAVSFPVTTSSTFRLSYGQNAQTPPLSTIFSNVLDDGRNTNTLYGRDVDIPRTIQFEAGYRQVFSGSTVIDVAMYSKTNRNSLSYRKASYTDPVTGAPFLFNVLENADYSIARGADVTLDKRISDVLDLTLNYSYIDARGTGSDPGTFTNIFARNTSNFAAINPLLPPEGPEILLPVDQSAAHTLSSIMTLQLPSDFARSNKIANAILGNVGVFTTARVQSGLPYTRLDPKVGGNLSDAGPPTSTFFGAIAEQLNASHLPMQKSLDARITKGFKVFNKQLSAFADFRNPLNLENTSSVYLQTGTVTHQALQDESILGSMQSALLDSNIDVKDFAVCRTPDVLSSCLGLGSVNSDNQESAVNRYMLIQAEKRFGNGDGIFTVAEQKNLYTTSYVISNGPQNRRNSIQSMRIGIEINF
jgi:hypothetical protein